MDEPTQRTPAAPVTRQTWTALIAAVLFVMLAAALALIPAPYATWTPGSTLNTLGEVDGRPVIRVVGGQAVDTAPATGQLDLTTVRVTQPDSLLSLPEALSAYWLPQRDALPREWIYPVGSNAASVEQLEQRQMMVAKEQAVVAALRAAELPVRQLPVVESVTAGFGAYEQLRVGDLVLAMNGVSVVKPGAFIMELRKQTPGEFVTLTIRRERVDMEVRLLVKDSFVQRGIPVLGFVMGTGYDYDPVVEFATDDLGGPSAGLVFALAVYDKVTPGSLIGNHHVAGTGTINANGDVGSISGIQQKIAAAEAAGAELFLLPAVNCPDLAGVRTRLKLVRVDRLSDAISALTLFSSGSEQPLPSC